VNHLTNVYSIVPRLPPAIDGVGDYALNLARQLRKDFNIQTHFIVGNPTWSGASEIEGFPVSKIISRSSDVLLNVLSKYPDLPILVHYVGYGYQKRGCPTWLINALERWRNLFPNRSLVTMFHEVYASGSPWNSAFWLSPLQKQLAGRLARSSDRCITSKEEYAQLIYQLNPDQKPEITCLPVFSNIGEPEYLAPLSERSRRLVIFGNRNSRLQVYNQRFKEVKAVCKILQINEISDIGVKTGLNLSEIEGISILERGVIESQEISLIMQDSIAGVLGSPPPTELAKSTIFAAYCAHGLVPCTIMPNPLSTDGLIQGKHYWCINAEIDNLSLYNGQKITNNAYTWYQQHSLSRQAKIFSQILSCVALTDS